MLKEKRFLPLAATGLFVVFILFTAPLFSMIASTRGGFTQLVNDDNSYYLMQQASAQQPTTTSTNQTGETNETAVFIVPKWFRCLVKPSPTFPVPDECFPKCPPDCFTIPGNTTMSRNEFLMAVPNIHNGLVAIIKGVLIENGGNPYFATKSVFADLENMSLIRAEDKQLLDEIINVTNSDLSPQEMSARINATYNQLLSDPDASMLAVTIAGVAADSIPTGEPGTAEAKTNWANIIGSAVGGGFFGALGAAGAFVTGGAAAPAVGILASTGAAVGGAIGSGLAD